MSYVLLVFFRNGSSFPNPPKTSFSLAVADELAAFLSRNGFPKLRTGQSRASAIDAHFGLGNRFVVCTLDYTGNRLRCRRGLSNKRKKRRTSYTSEKASN
jgi:hypothetical protein